MDQVILFVVIFGIVLLGVCMFFYSAYLFFEHLYGYFFNKTLFVHVYRKRLLLPFSDSEFLDNNFFYYKRLSVEQKKNFNHRIARFLLNYEFIAKEDFEVTQEIKLMVAATHIMLTFGFRKYLISTFDKIILFPNIYYSSYSEDYHKGEYNVRMKAVVFSWFHFLEGYEFGTSNLNLGIHEFTHAIQYYCMKSQDASAIIFTRFYNQIMSEIKKPQVKEKLINSDYFRIYAFTNSFEFLAVIMEHYFETPQQFLKEFPDLYKKVTLMLNH